MGHFLVIVSSILALLAAPVVCAESHYVNPVDKKIYKTLGQFKTYAPDVPRDTRGQQVTTQGVVLLTGEPDLKLRVKVEDLSAYIKSIEGHAYSELAKNKTPMAVLVQFNCLPGKCEIKLASQGQAEEPTLKAFYDVLSMLDPLKTTGEVIFQVMFNVAP